MLPVCHASFHTKQQQQQHAPPQLHASSNAFLRGALCSQRSRGHAWLPPLSSFRLREPHIHVKLLHEGRLRAMGGLEELEEQAEAAALLVQSLTARTQHAWQQAAAQASSLLAPSPQRVPSQRPLLLPRRGGGSSSSAVHATHAHAVSSKQQASGTLQHYRRQLQLLVHAAEQLPPVAAVMSCSPFQRLGLLVALLLAGVLPPLWRRHQEEADRRRQLQQLVSINAMDLERQKQRFQKALKVDSISAELPDLKEAQVNKVASAASQRGGSGGGGGDRMRRQWESFMSASKSEQVKDMWDAKGHGDDGAPRASKKQLEEMTARVRAASTGTSKKDYVSFDELCRGEEDFDAGMAERVAQRKARFQGQFLSDADVGLPSAPRRPAVGLDAAAHGSAPGAGRLSGQEARGQPGAAERGSQPGASRPQRLGQQGAGRSRLAADRQRGDELGGSPSEPLLEIRPRKQAPTSGDAAGPQGAASSSAPLLEVRPKRTQAMPAEAAGPEAAATSSPSLLEIRPKRTAAGAVSPASSSPQGARSAQALVRPLKLNAASSEIDGKQSLAMRSVLDHVHPSDAPTQAAPQAGEGQRLQRPGRPPLLQPQAAAATQAQGPVPEGAGPQAPEHAPADGGAQDEQADDGPVLYAPVSTVSLGLLRGASRARRAAEGSKLSTGADRAEPAPAPQIHEAGASQQQQTGSSLEHLIRRPAK